MFWSTFPPPSRRQQFWKVYTEIFFSISGTMGKIRAICFLPPPVFSPPVRLYARIGQSSLVGGEGLM
jgi:hypothetical protein